MWYTSRFDDHATLARSSDWKAALALALSNVIVAAYEARDLVALAKAAAADVRARSNAQALGAVVRGEAWLDDACAR